MFPDFLIYFGEVSLPAQRCKLQEGRDSYVVFTSLLAPNGCLLNDVSGSPIIHRQRRKKSGYEKDGEEERRERDKGEGRRDEGREWKERRVDGRRQERLEVKMSGKKLPVNNSRCLGRLRSCKNQGCSS